MKTLRISHPFSAMRRRAIVLRGDRLGRWLPLVMLAGCQLSDVPILLIDASPDSMVGNHCVVDPDSGVPQVNECGGCTALDFRPGTACGNCGGIYVCNSAESVVCNDKGYAQVKAIATGDVHTCVLMTNGVVRCWGYNGNGMLGTGDDPDRANRYEPPTTDALTGVEQLGAGSYHTCALMMNGDVRCFGYGGEGQLGNGMVADGFVPVKAETPPGVQYVIGGDVHTCALLANGGVRCWGSDGDGQLGVAQMDDEINGGDPMDKIRSHVPLTDVLTDVQAVAAADHTCALMRTSRGIRCWGANSDGQLGDGNAPVDLLSPPAGDLDIGIRLASIAVGRHHTCVMTTAPAIRCWGKNTEGQLGDGNAPNSRSTPPTVDAFGPVQAITAGDDHTCVLTPTGGVRCWGDNFYGQLGDGNYPNDRDTPLATDVIDKVRMVVAGGNHTCVLMVSGGVRCWGDNSNGQLGDGTMDPIRTTPPSVDVKGLDRICR